MQISDKKTLRRHFKEIRAQMDKNCRKDADIAVQKRFLESLEFAEAEMILAYVSSDIEVDTSLIIEESLKCKIVLCPRCAKSGNAMSFYRINSRADLEEGRFGIYEPSENCWLLEDFHKAICVVPALSYDKAGYRLGFGMGFYDRFLAGFDGLKIGIGYENCMSEQLIHDSFDISVDMLFTDKYIYDFRTEGKEVE